MPRTSPVLPGVPSTGRGMQVFSTTLTVVLTQIAHQLCHPPPARPGREHGGTLAAKGSPARGGGEAAHPRLRVRPHKTPPGRGVQGHGARPASPRGTGRAAAGDEPPRSPPAARAAAAAAAPDPGVSPEAAAQRDPGWSRSVCPRGRPRAGAARPGPHRRPRSPPQEPSPARPPAGRAGQPSPGEPSAPRRGPPRLTGRQAVPEPQRHPQHQVEEAEPGGHGQEPAGPRRRHRHSPPQLLPAPQRRGRPGARRPSAAPAAVRHGRRRGTPGEGRAARRGGARWAPPGRAFCSPSPSPLPRRRSAAPASPPRRGPGAPEGPASPPAAAALPGPGGPARSYDGRRAASARSQHGAGRASGPARRRRPDRRSRHAPRGAGPGPELPKWPTSRTGCRMRRR